MSKTTLLDYLKTQTTKEFYQIPLTKEELFSTNNENSKLLERLYENKVIQDFTPTEEDANDETLSPFCLFLPKKGYLNNLEHKDLISSKDEMAQQVKVLATMCSLYGQGANPKNLGLILQDITGQSPNPQELDNPELPDEEKQELHNAIVEYNQVTADEKKILASTLGNPENEKILATLLNTDASDKTEKLIATVTRFFELRFPKLNLTAKEVTAFHKNILAKIELFIRYEAMQWDVKAVPKELKRYIVCLEG